MANELLYGIIGVLIVAGLVTGGILLTQEQIDYGYTCTTTNVTGIFDHFSSTNKTAYYNDENGTMKQVVCPKGYWIPTKQWAEINGINITQLESHLPVPEELINATSEDENGIEIIEPGEIIVVDENKEVNIGGIVYNISYEPVSTVIKCICERATGCLNTECLS